MSSGQGADGPDSPASATRLRLLKVVAQFVFVVDDGETLVEQVSEPVTIPGSRWPRWALNEYPTLFSALESQVTGGNPDEGPAESGRGLS